MNPTRDELIEEAKTKPITVDALAITHTETLAALDEYKDKPCLRVYLEGKGCDGFSYGVAFDSKNENDIAFLIKSESFSFELICDPDSFQFVKGANITFVNDMRGVGYVVENPRHNRFKGKFYKKKVWQERLLEKREKMEQAATT